MKSNKLGTFPVIIILSVSVQILFAGIWANPAGSYCEPQYVIRNGEAIPFSKLTAGEMAELLPPRFEGDTLKVLVVPIEWLEPAGYRPSTYPREALDTIFFSRNIRPNGSVIEYFEEVSYGQLTIEGNVLDWVDGGNYSSYGGPDWILPALQYLDPVIDFSQYDGNGDGFIDALVIVLAKNAKQDTGCDTDI